MTDVLIQEWNEEGEALEWVGPLLNIAEELLTEWEHPETESILSRLRHPKRHWPVTHTPVGWFCRKMNKHSETFSVSFTGEVMG